MNADLVDVGPPRWVWRALVITAVVVAFAVVLTAVIVGHAALQRQARIEMSIDAQRADSARNDCRAVISAARRDVLDQLAVISSIDQTVHDQILGNALIESVSGTRASPEEIAAYQANNANVTADVALARTLPSTLPTVDDVVDHGGDMPVLHNDRTVTSIHFDACPTVG